MNAVLVENMPSNIIKKFGKKIDYNVLYTYINDEKKYKKNVENMELLEYINSDEYKNEKENYQSPEDFLFDLKNMRN